MASINEEDILERVIRHSPGEMRRVVEIAGKEELLEWMRWVEFLMPGELGPMSCAVLADAFVKTAELYEAEEAGFDREQWDREHPGIVPAGLSYEDEFSRHLTGKTWRDFQDKF